MISSWRPPCAGWPRTRRTASGTSSSTSWRSPASMIRDASIRVPWRRRKIRLIESNAKCRHLKKLTREGTLRQVFICLRPFPLLSFCLRRSSNFVGSESGQIQSVKLLQNMISNTTQHPPSPSQPHTVCIYSTRTQGQYFWHWFTYPTGWGMWTREKVRGAWLSVYKLW